MSYPARAEGLVNSIYSLPPSADCVLWTAISSRLFSSVLLCQLHLSFFSGIFSPPLPVSREISPSGPLCWFCAKIDKEILWPAPTQNEMNATHCVTFVNNYNSKYLFLIQNTYYYMASGNIFAKKLANCVYYILIFSFFVHFLKIYIVSSI